MRVAIGPVDPAGTAGGLAAGLRALGVDAEVVLWFAFPHRRMNGKLVGRRGRLAFALRAPIRTDVFHYQSFTWLPRLLDARWARARRRTLIVTFHGDDCRRYGIGRRLFPSWKVLADADRDTAVEWRVRALGRSCDAAIVANLELATYVLPFFRRTYVVPLALERPPPATGTVENSRLVVLHAPSVRELKGTAAIERAVAAAAARASLEFRLLEGVSHEEALAQVARADVVVDQLDSPTIGVVALEALAAGKPVLSELDERALAPYQRDLPVVAATAESLAHELVALLADEDRRRRLGEDGRRYAERHRPEAVARATLQVYAHARGDARGRLFEAGDTGVRPLPAEEETIVARLRGG